MQEPRLYIITRADLPPGLRAAQAGHAIAAFALEHPRRFRRWNNRYLLMLEVPDLGSLARAGVHARLRGISQSAWCEPDLGNELTSIALAPSWRTTNFCSQYPLLLHQVSLPPGTSSTDGAGGVSPGREPSSGSSTVRAPVSTTGDEGSTPSRLAQLDSGEVM